MAWQTVLDTTARSSPAVQAISRLSCTADYRFNFWLNWQPEIKENDWILQSDFASHSDDAFLRMHMGPHWHARMVRKRNWMDPETARQRLTRHGLLQFVHNFHLLGHDQLHINRLRRCHRRNKPWIPLSNAGRNCWNLYIQLYDGSHLGTPSPNWRLGQKRGKPGRSHSMAGEAGSRRQRAKALQITIRRRAHLLRTEIQTRYPPNNIAPDKRQEHVLPPAEASAQELAHRRSFRKEVPCLSRCVWELQQGVRSQTRDPLRVQNVHAGS